MKSSLVPLAALMLTATVGYSESFTIAGVTFDQDNSVRTAGLVEGSGVLEDHSNKNFGKYSEDYLRSPTVTYNEFSKFDRTRTLGFLAGRGSSGSASRHISLNAPAGTRSTLELTWGTDGLPNGKGADFYIFESGNPDRYSVSVRKVGSNEFTPFYYKFTGSEDKLHAANATAFELSDFGFADGEVCAAIRIRNIWGKQTKAGPDKVNNESGQGILVPPSHPDYKNAFALRVKAGDRELIDDELDPDVVYVVGRHSLVPLKGAAPQAASTPKEDVVSTEKK